MSSCHNDSHKLLLGLGLDFDGDTGGRETVSVAESLGGVVEFGDNRVLSCSEAVC